MVSNMCIQSSFAEISSYLGSLSHFIVPILVIHTSANMRCNISRQRKKGHKEGICCEGDFIKAVPFG